MGIFTAIGTGAGAYFGGPWGAAAGAAIGAGLDGSIGAANANQANRDIAYQNREWQEMMSSSAYKRAVLDMREAGLNPILAAGSPASTPAGSTATMMNEAEPLATAAKDVGAMVMQKEALKKQDTEIGLMETQKQTNAAQAEMYKTQAQKNIVDASVAKKGIPEAELKNSVYDWLKKKASDMFGTNAQKEISRKRSIENARKFFQKGKP